MPGPEHKNFFLTRKALALLPLLLMSAGVWYFIQSRVPGQSEGASQGAPQAVFGAGTEGPKSAPLAAAPVAGEESGSGAAAARIPEAYDPKAGMEIQGPPEFKSQVTSALRLIWMADRETFLMIRRSLYVIRNETRTGFYMENGRPVAALSRQHAFRSLTWCAGIIAHQAWHAAYELNQKKRRSKNFTPPPPGGKSELKVEANPRRLDYKGLEDILYVEDKASAFQLEVLRKVGAPARETGPVLRRAPRDFTHGHDGGYAVKP